MNTKRAFYNYRTVLEEKFKLEFKKVMSCGSYSNVIGAEESKTNDAIAVKIIFREKITDGITKIWPYVRHQNILPLLRWEFVLELDAYFMLSPILPYSLAEVVINRNFIKDDTAIYKAQKWIGEITSALEYLHGKRLCHLGVRCENVLINHEWSAVICGFRTANAAVAPSYIYDVNKSDMSPEVVELANRFPRTHIDAIPFDIWALGMLTLNIFTQNYVHRKIAKKPLFWHRDVYPTIFQTMQEKHFKRLIEKAFPSCDVDKESAEVIRNFITTCLKIYPDGRPSTKMLLKHRFLKKEGFMEEPGKIWRARASSSCIMRTVHGYLDEKSTGNFTSGRSYAQHTKVSLDELKSGL